jgi:hypothetical protein
MYHIQTLICGLRKLQAAEMIFNVTQMMQGASTQSKTEVPPNEIQLNGSSSYKSAYLIR